MSAFHHFRLSADAGQRPNTRQVTHCQAARAIPSIEGKAYSPPLRFGLQEAPGKPAARLSGSLGLPMNPLFLDAP